LQLIAGLTAAAGAAATAYAIASRSPRLEARRRTVLITGGSRGLGLALATRYGRSGARLILAARSVDDLTQARYTLLNRRAIRSSDDVLLIPADLTDPAQAGSLIDHAISHFGRVDVLINNAGIIEVGPVENQPLSAYRRAMQTNFFAALHTTQAILPHLLANRAGSIVNIASIGGKFAMPHLLPYVASKFALVGFSQGLHAELRHKGIRVTTVCPGLMRTGSHVHARFTGDEKKESRWFTIAATTPVVAASIKHAANCIYLAEVAGRAEITITPQAWLTARLAGLAPEATQRAAALVNEYILPDPVSDDQLSLHFRYAATEPVSAAETENATEEEPPEEAVWPMPSPQPLM
jgi:short-subunit dehydrogenase